LETTKGQQEKAEKKKEKTRRKKEQKKNKEKINTMERVEHLMLYPCGVPVEGLHVIINHIKKSTFQEKKQKK